MSQSLEFKIPEGYVFDKENSTDEVIRFKPRKITYNDICKELFLNKPSWRLNDLAIITRTPCSIAAIIHHNTISTSHKQLQQLLSLNKLMNVAKYLNGDWEPDFTNGGEQKWYIRYDCEYSKLKIDYIYIYKDSNIYFKLEELALQAIEILGEEELKKALGIFK